MKKKKLLLGCFLAVISIAFGNAAEDDGYIPLVKPGKIWSCFTNYCKYPEYIRYRIDEADTIFGEKTFKKIYAFITPEFNRETALCFGGIREENKRVYLWQELEKIPQEARRRYGQLEELAWKGLCSEVLLYDFNLNKGDTCNICNDSFSSTKVFGVDTVSIHNKMRKRLDVYMPRFGGGYWIEGYGSTRGLLGHLSSPLDHIAWDVQLSAIEEDGERYHFDYIFPSDRFIAYSFAPIGTQWYYGTKEKKSGVENYIRYECTGEEMVDSKNCAVIEAHRELGGVPDARKRYIYQSDTTIYQYVATTQKFVPLYKFSMRSYMNYIVEYPHGDIAVETDDCIDEIQNNTYFLNQEIWLKRGNEKKQTIIAENIGSKSLFFYFDMFETTEGITGLRCYYHPDLGWFSWGDKACEYSKGMDQADVKRFNLFCRDRYIQVADPQHEIHKIQIIDVKGNVVIRFDPTDGALYRLPSAGIWLYKLQLSDGMEITGKLVAE